MIEKRFAKVINSVTKQCSVAVGTDKDFYKKEGFVEKDVELSCDGNWYLAGYAPQKSSNQMLQEQIEELEKRITERNLRSALLGDSYAKHKIEVIEAQISELRKQLEGGAQ